MPDFPAVPAKKISSMLASRPSVTSLFRPLLRASALSAIVALGCEPLPSKTAAEAASEQPAPAVAAPAPAPDAEPHAAERQAARSSARQWLALIDQSHYGDSWEAAAPVFQSSLTKEQWGGAVQQARAPLGALASRKFRAAEYKDSLPGAPQGEYVIVYYDSSFSAKPSATESVTLAKAPDNSWRAAGYFIQ